MPLQHTFLFALLCHFLFGTSQATPLVVTVVPVDDSQYQCTVSDDPGDTTYTWFREDREPLPDGVEAEGNVLRFKPSMPDLNGVYTCEVANQKGKAAGSVYRYYPPSKVAL